MSRPVPASAKNWFLFAVLVAIVGTFISWPVLDAPSGPCEVIEGRVTQSLVASDRYGHSDIKTTVVVPGGIEVTYFSARLLPVGSLVPCTRFQRRLSGAFNYKC